MCDEKKMAALGTQISALVPVIATLDKTLTVTNANMVHLTEEVKTITEENQAMRKTVYGNGNPSGGLSGRVKQIESWIENQVWFQRLLIALVVGEAVGIIYIVVNHVLGS